MIKKKQMTKIKAFLDRRLYLLVMIVFTSTMLYNAYQSMFRHNIDTWHWLQTRSLSEDSGTAILKKCETNNSKGIDYYSLELIGQNNPVFIQYESRTDRIAEVSDKTCLDASKAFNILKDTPLNTIVSVRWVTKTNGQWILTAINNQANIGNNRYDDLLFSLVWMMMASIFLAIVSYPLTGLTEYLIYTIFGVKINCLEEWKDRRDAKDLARKALEKKKN